MGKASVLIIITMKTLMVVNWSSPEEEHEKTVPKTKIKWLVFFALILSPCTQTEVVEM